MTVTLVSWAIIAAVTFYLKWWLLLLLCIPGLWILKNYVSRTLLLLRAIRSNKKTDVAGVFVTSNSPNWSEYVRKRWLETYPGRFEVLNWSERDTWEDTLPVILYKRFCSYEKNFCPVVILFRGLRYPLIFRFYYALRDHRHGNDRALNMLEERLTRELEK